MKVAGLLIPGNIINLFNRKPTSAPAGPSGFNPDAGSSTTLSKSFNINGKEVLLPTVIDGRFHTDQEAIERFYKTGQHLGQFDSPASASAYAAALHNEQERLGAMYGAMAVPTTAINRTGGNQ